jgi:rhodanese-related sulfurtransferase
MTQLQEEISPQDLKLLLDSSTELTLIDVRDDWEVELCHIEGCMHYTFAKLAVQAPSLDKTQPIVTYCHHGVRSRNAMLILRQQGFNNVASLKGGIDAWSRDVDPLVPKY